ncbi:hypothetical protein RQP46_011115 [Phenoliferia psychrophenolica]
MATINHLPPELLHFILQYIHADQTDERDEAGHTAVLHALASTSLVARRWQRPAQSLLWSSLVLNQRKHIPKLLASESIGRYRTKELVLLRSTACIKVASARRRRSPLACLVDALEGVEKLIVNTQGDEVPEAKGLPVDWLSSSKLHGLKTLLFNAEFLPDGVRPRPIVPEFHLTTFYLGWAIRSSRVADAILDASTSTLQELIIKEMHEDLTPSLSNFLSHTNSNLKSLTVNADQMSHAATLTSLAHLSILIGNVEDIKQAERHIGSLSSTIEELGLILSVDHVWDVDEQDVRKEQPGMLLDRMGTKAWEGLKFIDFTGVGSLEDIAALPQGALLIKRCEDLGIELMHD